MYTRDKFEKYTVSAEKFIIKHTSLRDAQKSSEFYIEIFENKNDCKILWLPSELKPTLNC